MYFKKIESERIYLSPLNIEDAEKYSKWMNDRIVTDKIGCTSKLNNVIVEKEWITKQLEKGEYCFAIVLKETDELIGNCGIMSPNFIDGTATLGIFIGEEDKRGKGYGSEALNMLLDYGFNYLNLHNINLSVVEFNKRAISCYKGLGFKEYARRHESYYLDGKYHDQIFMEILKKDYKKEKIEEV